MSRHTFTRRDGSSFTIEVEVDSDKLALDLARLITRVGRQRATKAGGAIVATVITDTRKGATA